MLERISNPTPRAVASLSKQFRHPVLIESNGCQWPMLFDAELDRIAATSATVSPRPSAGLDRVATVTEAVVTSDQPRPRVTRHRVHSTVHQIASTSEVAMFAPSAVSSRAKRHALRHLGGAAEHFFDDVRSAVGIEPHSIALQPGDTLFVPRRWWAVHHQSVDSRTVRSYWAGRRRADHVLTLLGFGADRAAHPSNDCAGLAPLRDGFDLPRHDAD